MDERWHQEIERARRMTPDERVREGFALFDQGRNYILQCIRESVPEATDADVDRILTFVLKRCKWWGIT
jgi:hypothetical protein